MYNPTIEQYRRKRDFSRTPEPPYAAERYGLGPLMFVIQKHNASRMHYDLRLEVDGVLKSWAVPKGPSLDPRQKRLAVIVEDHPVDDASFEGVIPRGSYGAGQVIVWDCGTYLPDEGVLLSSYSRSEAEECMRRDLGSGRLSIFLFGHKLRGAWTLVKMMRGERNWLLVKHKDSFAEAEHDILTEGRSVISGMNIEDLAEGHLPAP